MKKIYLLLLSLYLFACSTEQKDTTSTSTDSTTVATADTTKIEGSPNNFYCVPGKQAGNVVANSTEQSLIEILGKENVVRDTIYGAEGEFLIGTTLFKGTPNQAQIIWKDTVKFAKPDIVLIRPETNGNQSEWLVEGNIKIGTTLKEIEKLNQKPFAMSGFGWDYGGFITDWKGGKLSNADGTSNLTIGFGYDFENESQQKLAEKVMGDNSFISSTPALQQLNPKVTEIGIRF